MVEPARIRDCATLVLVIGVLVSAIVLVRIHRLDHPARPDVKPPTAKDALIAALAPTIHDDQSKATLLAALRQSIRGLERREMEKEITWGTRSVRRSDIVHSLELFASKLEQSELNAEFFSWVQDSFDFAKSSARQVLFTGYFEASLQGSLTETKEFKYPLYALPDDLVRVPLKQFFPGDLPAGLPDQLIGRVKGTTLVPFYDRLAIDYQGALQNRDLELVWTDDPVKLFFLQIQGSGVIQLPDGKALRVGYAGKNGHVYRAIGKLLLEKGAIERSKISMQTIQEYLYQHPEEMQEVFLYNPSYVFFREVPNGPIGSLGVRLTPYRSIATDHRLFPHGALVYIETEKPVFAKDGTISTWEKFGRFVLNQDTGGAIRGTARADLFTGFGPEAEMVAGHMQHKGSFYFLLAKVAQSSPMSPRSIGE